MSKGSIGDPNLPLWVKMGTAGISGCVAEIMTIPFDTAKVRLQLSGVQQQTKYKGLLGTLSTIQKEEGFRALFKGLSSGLCRQIVFCSFRIGLYEPVKNLIVPKNQQKEPSLFYKALAGVITGGFGILIANPTDVVKVRLQAQGKLPEGVARQYNGMSDAYIKIFQKEGLRGFWSGCSANIFRNSIFNAAELASYDHAKEYVIKHNLMNDGFPCHFVVSAWAGFFTSCIGQPIDQIKTRLMNQKDNKYKGILDCIVKTIKNEGILAFYDGFSSNATRVISWNICMFVTLQQVRGIADRQYFPGKY